VRAKITPLAVTWVVTVVAILSVASCAHAAVVQKSVSRIDKMANVPQPLKVIDFHELAENFDRTIYDFSQTGDHWPMIWWDRSGVNFNQPIVAIYTAVGDSRQGASVHGGQFHEALTSMGAVLGASLNGIDKSKGLNYVGMLKNYFNRDSGWNIMQNNINADAGKLGGGYGRDWWYDVFPNVLFYGIYSQYPNEKDFDWMARSIADKFYQADEILNGNYNFTFFDYKNMKPMTSSICAQPDAAAGHSYVLYNAYKKFGDARYLTASKRALTALEKNTINPSYEVLMPFGAYMAARMNAVEGTSFDVTKMLNFSLDGTAVCRAGWGALVGRWNGVDVSGVIGSTVDNGGYGFLMNTYDMAWPLVPLVRYDQSYANAIGKWMLNAANAAKLFYPQHVPAQNQTLAMKAAVTKGVIAYEGITKTSSYDQYKSTTTSPVAQGDGPRWTPTNPDVSQFSVYGSAHVGIFGGLIQTTNVEGILQLDLLKTDFFHDPAYPSYLVSNPYTRAHHVRVRLPDGRFDLYDTVSGQFIARDVSSQPTVSVPARSSVVIVATPVKGALVRKDGRLFVNEIVVDYHID
jgi:hypothetical protein